VVDGPSAASTTICPRRAVAVQAEPKGTGDAVRRGRARSPTSTVVVIIGDVPLSTPRR
jgi:bifunctional N-acetylglucosamine-1-phosphate-uridyltransferase/glucosamine-1-phosphate-acetyltransferase GlmU-like protein